MISRRSNPFTPAGVVLALYLATLPAWAQDATLESLVEGSRAAIAEKDWERALDFNTRAIAEFGSDQPFRKYGAQFGVIFYRKGLCEMRLKQWKDAMESFETCYRDFPNEGADNGNTCQKMALRKWAESAMGAEEWELAISRFAKFIAERDKTRDTFPQGSYYINVAVCHYRLGQIAEGSENLEIAIRNKAVFPTSDIGIITGFQALVSAVIASRNEQALLDFIGKNRGVLLIPPYEMYQFSPVFMKLAGDAISVGMRRAAMELYQLIPSTDVAIDDVRARLKAMGGASQIKDGGATYNRGKLEEDLATFEADRRGKRATETIRLAAVAFLHEASGNFTGAYAAYQQLESYYPGAEKREENLFNLIRVASRIGLSAELRGYADTYMKEFPTSARIAEVKGLILSTLDGENDVAGRIAIAGPMLETLKEGTPEHELCLYLLGTSCFESGDDGRARELLERHARLYPDGAHAADSAFYQASSAARLRQWDRAAALYDGFLTNYPESPFVASALYGRAACHFEAGELDAALGKINRLNKEFPDSPAAARACNLLGNIGRAQGKPDEAEKAFLNAFRIASARDDRATAGESLCLLVELLGRSGTGGDVAGRMRDAVSHADRFWKDHAEGSPFQTRVAVAQVRAFVKAGRGEEALGRLKGIVARGAAGPGGNGALVDAYAEAYLASHSPAELAGQFEDFPGIDPADRGLLARMRMAVIGAYETAAATAGDDTRKAEAAAELKSLYQKMKAEFAPADLDTATLIRMGDHLRQNTSTPREALAYYDEAIGRDDAAMRATALLGRADVGSRSRVPAEVDSGIADFRKVYAESELAVERGYALFRIVEALMAKGDFASAVDEATRYLGRGEAAASDIPPRVRLMLARSYQELRRTDEAIGEYAGIWSDQAENLDLSAPAMICWMRLLWTRNRDAADGGKPSDRQLAYEGGAGFLERARPLAAALPEADLGPWHEIEQAVRTFATSPGIRPLDGEGGTAPPKDSKQ